jgi:hypothetical protein
VNPPASVVSSIKGPPRAKKERLRYSEYPQRHDGLNVFIEEQEAARGQRWYCAGKTRSSARYSLA